MNGLGMISQTYMFILLVLLFVGSGMAVWSFLNFIVEKSSNKPLLKQKKVVVNSDPSHAGSIIKNYGGKVMNNGWLKLAVFSFVGILVSVIVLGFVSASGSNTMNMAGNTMTGNSIHQQHQQQGMTQNGYAQMQGTIDPNMQMQGNMNGNMSAQMSGMNGMTGQQSGNEYMMMQQQLNQMQMQLNQIQQQQMGMAGSSMNSNMQSGGMSNMQQSGGMGMGMGMMPMMNMGGSMSSMPQSNSSMSSMPQNSSSSSSGSGGGMGMM